MTHKLLNISLPQGVRDILPEEARKVRYIEDTVTTVFEKNGFKRVITPILEYLDVLQLGLGADLKDKIFKFVDPASGKIVAVRPDITPQVARLVAARMKDYPMPLKLYYNENTLRYEDAGGGAQIELHQIGAEYIGKDTPEADAEIIAIAVEALQKTRLKDFKIDIGHIGFFKGILEEIKVDADTEKKIKDTVLRKDSSSLQRILSSLKQGKNSSIITMLIGLPSLFGDIEIIDRIRPDVMGKNAKNALDDLKRVLNILKKNGFKKYITIDLGEIRGFDYYTGVIFEGFAKGIGKPILRGGRYNNLLEKYGYPCPATGFAFDVESAVAALK